MIYNRLIALLVLCAIAVSVAPDQLWQFGEEVPVEMQQEENSEKREHADEKEVKIHPTAVAGMNAANSPRFRELLPHGSGLPEVYLAISTPPPERVL